MALADEQMPKAILSKWQFTYFRSWSSTCLGAKRIRFFFWGVPKKSANRTHFFGVSQNNPHIYVFFWCVPKNPHIYIFLNPHIYIFRGETHTSALLGAKRIFCVGLSSALLGAIRIFSSSLRFFLVCPKKIPQMT